MQYKIRDWAPGTGNRALSPSDAKRIDLENLVFQKLKADGLPKECFVVVVNVDVQLMMEIDPSQPIPPDMQVFTYKMDVARMVKVEAQPPNPPNKLLIVDHVRDCIGLGDDWMILNRSDKMPIGIHFDLIVIDCPMSDEEREIWSTRLRSGQSLFIVNKK